MQEISRSLPTVLFTLRFWQETLDDTRSEWRGEVKNLSTAEVRYFRTWEEMAVLVPKMLHETSFYDQEGE